MKYRITLEVAADAPWGNEPPLDDLAGWTRYLDLEAELMRVVKVEAVLA